MRVRKTLQMGAAGAACAAMLMTAVGCSSQAEQPKSEVPEAVDLKGETVVSLFTSMNNDYFSGWDQGAREAVEAFNGTYVGLTNEGDPATQISQMQQQIDAGVRIFFVAPPDPSSVPEMAKLAEENDVCFANTWDMTPWDSPFAYGDQYTNYLSPNSVQAGYDTAVALFEEMGGKGKLVHLTGHPGSTADSQRTEAVDRALEEYPDIELVDRQPGEWNRDDSRNAMNGIISRVGADQIDGVFGQNDDVAIGAMNALQEAGAEDVPIVGLDGNVGTIELIESGDIFASSSSLPQWQAGFSFVQALDACLSGETPPPLDRQLWTGGLLITQDNVAEYMETYGGDTTPYDWVKMSRVAYPEDWDPQNKVEAMVMEEMWAFDEANKPDELPEEYISALTDLESANEEWDSHWKLLRNGE